MRALDLFAGPGGWDLGARQLGINPLGVELDPDACATRRAAGLRTLQADVAEEAPAAYGPVDLLIASPPCQTFSQAGGRAGAADEGAVLAVMADLADGDDNRHMASAGAQLTPPGSLFPAPPLSDPRSLLVVEPLRYALALRPRWIACEQVPPVLPLWEAMAGYLAAHGYRTWTGLLRADEYGVPQTRERAFLLASLDGPVGPPEPSHQRWAGKGSRPVLPRDVAGRLPWVTMAAALGWDEADAVGFPRRNDQDDGGEYRERDLRSAGDPALLLTEKSRSWTRTLAGDPRVHPPGHKANGNDEPGRYEERRGANAVRVTLDEAAILQGFPAGYPWQGTNTARFRQVGNAVPPPMARAVVAALVGAAVAA